MQDYPADWFKGARHSGEEWLLLLEYGDGTNFIAISSTSFVFKTGGTADRYRAWGLLASDPTISESIDIEKGVYKSGDCTFTALNENITSTLFSAQTPHRFSQLFFGDVALASPLNFINRNCYLYSKVGTKVQDTSDMALLYSGKINDISQARNTVTIKTTSARPYSGLTIPYYKSEKGTYYPVAYGDFQHEQSDTSSPQFVTNAHCFPVPVEKEEEGVIKCLVPDGLTGNMRLHSWNDHLEQYIPIMYDPTKQIDDWADADSKFLYETRADGTTGHIVKCRNDLFSTYKVDITDPKICKVEKVTSTSQESNIINQGYVLSSAAVSGNWGWDITDTPSGDLLSNQSADHGVNYTEGANSNVAGTYYYRHYVRVYFNPPPQIKKAEMTIGYMEIHMTGTSGAGLDYELQVMDDNGTESAITALSRVNVFTNNSRTNTTLTIDLDNGTPSEHDYFQLHLRAKVVDAVTTNASVDFHWEMRDFKDLVFTEYLDLSEDPTGAGASREARDFLYCGADGRSRSYSGGSGPCLTPNEVLRDLLAREIGWDTLDANLDGWSDLVAARTNWKCRYALVKPKKVKEVIDKLAYEGGFVFKMRPSRDATKKGRFIFVKDQYNPNTDIDHIITSSDISEAGTRIRSTGIQNVVTDRTIGYNYHHGLNKHIDILDAKNSEVRTKLNLELAQNKQDVKLDSLVGSVGQVDSNGELIGNINSGFANYYNGINGDVRLTVSCDIVNPKFFNMECGDTVMFRNKRSQDGLDQPLGSSWDNVAFMITKLSRKRGSVSIECRQVTDSFQWCSPIDNTFPSDTVASGSSLTLQWNGADLGLGWDLLVYKDTDSTNQLLYENTGITTTENSGVWSTTLVLNSTVIGTPTYTDSLSDDNDYRIYIRPSGGSATAGGASAFKIGEGHSIVWPETLNKPENWFFVGKHGRVANAYNQPFPMGKYWFEFQGVGFPDTTKWTLTMFTGSEDHSVIKTTDVQFSAQTHATRVETPVGSGIYNIKISWEPAITITQTDFSTTPDNDAYCWVKLENDFDSRTIESGNLDGAIIFQTIQVPDYHATGGGWIHTNHLYYPNEYFDGSTDERCYSFHSNGNTYIGKWDSLYSGNQALSLYAAQNKNFYHVFKALETKGNFKYIDIPFDIEIWCHHEDPSNAGQYIESKCCKVEMNNSATTGATVTITDNTQYDQMYWWSNSNGSDTAREQMEAFFDSIPAANTSSTNYNYNFGHNFYFKYRFHDTSGKYANYGNNSQTTASDGSGGLFDNRIYVAQTQYKYGATSDSKSAPCYAGDAEGDPMFQKSSGDYSGDSSLGSTANFLRCFNLRGVSDITDTTPTATDVKIGAPHILDFLYSTSSVGTQSSITTSTTLAANTTYYITWKWKHLSPGNNINGSDLGGHGTRVNWLLMRDINDTLAQDITAQTYNTFGSRGMELSTQYLQWTTPAIINLSPPWFYLKAYCSGYGDIQYFITDIHITGVNNNPNNDFIDHIEQPQESGPFSFRTPKFQIV